MLRQLILGAGQVFKQALYVAVAVLTSFLILSVTAWYSQGSTAALVLGGELSVLEKFRYVGGVYWSLVTTSSAFGTAVIFCLSILFGLHTAVLIYYIRRIRRCSRGVKRFYTTSTTGFLLGLLGIGCAACGSIILTALAVSLGAGGWLLLLPWHGQEFGVIGITFLALSLFQLLIKIQDPLVCDTRACLGTLHKT